MNRTQSAKDFYDHHLNDPYSKQRETAAFHLLGLQLDSTESRYDHNSGAVGNYNSLKPIEVTMSFDNGTKDPFDGA